MKRRHFGILMVITSAILLLPCVLMVFAPLIARAFFHGYYSLTADTKAIQEGLTVAMLGGAGFVGGMWLIHANKSN